MATADIALVDVREVVLRTLKDADHRPMDLLVGLGQLGYFDSDIKEAVSELIHECKIELTSHRMLRIFPQPAI